MFSKLFPYVSCMFESISVINKGGRRSIFGKNGSSENVKQSIAIYPQAKNGNLGIL